MKRSLPRGAIAAPTTLLAALLLGCIAHPGPGPVPVRMTASHGIGYFGPPVGFHYGVWGPRYRVAPFHAPVRTRVAFSAHKGPRPFVAAPFGRPVPTISGRPRPRRWPALAPPAADWAYRFNDRSSAGENDIDFSRDRDRTPGSRLVRR